jgi:hypothetical protein
MPIRPAFLVVFFIWGSLIMGQLAFILVLITKEAPPQGASSASVFALLAGINAALSFVIRHFMLGGFARGTLSIETPAGQTRFTAGNIIVFALCESIGVFGFIQGQRHAEQSVWLPFIGGSILLLLAHIPWPARFTPARAAA